jgi:UDP-N-acetylglucosamine 2-epimerase (non-hydrolysing)
MKKIMIVIGTRPEAIKMCSLVKELKQHKSIETIFCVTGQHKEMLDQVLTAFSITPDYNLKVMKTSQSLKTLTKNIYNKLDDILNIEKPDLIVVHGDTTTTFVASLLAFYRKIDVAHVEAGLRTYNIYSPYPEEFNRRVVSLIAKLHFAPTLLSKLNLLKEGVSKDCIFVTGNTAIDALSYTINKDYSDDDIAWAAGYRLLLLTAHRRENFGDTMFDMLSAINQVIKEPPDTKLLFPVHLNPKVREIAYRAFNDNSRVRLVEPMDVIKFHNIMNKSFFIITDSGGIQEEAPSLKKPVLVMRETTERPEGIKAGTLRLIGNTYLSVYFGITSLLNNPDEYVRMANSKNPYGDGKASQRISDKIIKMYGE